MRSSWMLIKTQRRTLIIGSILCFLAQFLLAFDLKPSYTEKVATLIGLSLVFSTVASAIGGLHTKLFRLPFPVTNRQLAWLPTLFLGILYIAGGLGMLCGLIALSTLGVRSYSFSQWVPLLQIFLKLIPITFLFLSMSDRLLRYFGFNAVMFLFVLQPMFFSKETVVMEYLIMLYTYGWPLCIMLGIFLFSKHPPTSPRWIVLTW